MNKLVKTILGISQSMSINIKDKKIIDLFIGYPIIRSSLTLELIRSANHD
jgi:hypothetical protein